MGFGNPGNIKPEGGSEESRRKAEEAKASGMAWRGIKEGLISFMSGYLEALMKELMIRNALSSPATLSEIEQKDPKGFAEILRKFGIKYRNTGKEITKEAIRRALKNLGLVDPQELDQESERLWKIISQQEESSEKPQSEESQNE
jgi:hypothetical protein